MKKVIKFLLCLLFALTILFPVGALVSGCFGYTFELTSFLAVSVIIAVISVFTVLNFAHNFFVEKPQIICYNGYI